MAIKPAVELPVRWALSVGPDGAGKLAFAGKLDADSRTSFRMLGILDVFSDGTQDIFLQERVREKACFSNRVLYVLYAPFQKVILGTQINLHILC